MRDYQTVKERAIPHDVWMQTLAIIRGYYRRLENLNNAMDETNVPDVPGGSGVGSVVESKAAKRERDRDVVAAIDKAIYAIPEEYRVGVWRKVMFNERYPRDADLKTYSRHKADFVLRVALYLEIW